MKSKLDSENTVPSTQQKINHIEFNVEDFCAWQKGKSHEEVGRTVTAISMASEAGDEKYLEQFHFIDRIVYGDGSIRKVIRGSGKIDDLPQVAS
jgi:hypothetical protein